MTDVTTDVIARLAAARGPDRGLDALVWLAADVGQADREAARRWRECLPLSPRRQVNGRTMAEAIRLFPNDLDGIARAWNVAPLTASLDAALGLAPDDTRRWAWLGLAMRRCDECEWDFASLPRAVCIEALEALPSLRKRRAGHDAGDDRPRKGGTP